jgi:SAM-dependent methyltransferase
MDIGAGYGTFLEELTKAEPNIQAVAVEPSDSLSEVCRGKGLTVVKKFMEDMEPGDIERVGPAVFTSFELMEHLHDPSGFLSSCRKVMSPGDLLVFTTLSGTGLDIQTLWERSKSVSPPHHLNFFNPWSIRALIERNGLEVLEVTTPGKLDVDILENSLEDVKDRFLKTFLTRADRKAKEGLQRFLQDNNMSSHMMVVARKARQA